MITFHVSSTLITQTPMQSDSIVVAFDIAEDLCSGLPDVLERPAFEQFQFESREETLGTSFPKGAAITHKQLGANVEQIGKVMLGNEENKRITVGWLPVHHDMGFVGSLLVSFYHGIELYLIPTETFIRNPAIWLKTISDVRAVLSPAPAFAYELLGSRISDSRLKGINLSSWRYAWVGAEPIFHQMLRKFNERFTAYGLPKENSKTRLDLIFLKY